MLNVGRRDAKSRIAHLLCGLLFRRECLGSPSDLLDLPITQDHIADATGLTPVHVNRTLRRMQTDGLLHRQGVGWRILDRKRFMELADFNSNYLHPASIDREALSIAPGQRVGSTYFNQLRRGSHAVMSHAISRGREMAERNPREMETHAHVATGAGLALMAAATAIGAQYWISWLGSPPPLWPTTGLAIAALRKGGIRIWPIVAGTLVAGGILSREATIPIAMVDSGTQIAVAVLGLMILTRLRAPDRESLKLDDMLAIGLTSLITAVLTATVQVALHGIVGLPSPAAPSAQFAQTVLAIGLGTLLVLSLSECQQRPTMAGSRWLRWLHFGLMSVANAGVSYAVFVLTHSEPVAWMIFPFLIWAAIAFQLPGALLALILLTVIATFGTVTNAGPFASTLLSAPASQLLLGQFLTVASLTTLVLAALADDRRAAAALERLNRRLAEREQIFGLFIDDAPAAIAMFDRDMRYIAASRRFATDYGVDTPDQLIGRSHYDVFPDMPARWRAIHRRVLDGEHIHHDEDSFPRANGGTDYVRWKMKPWRDRRGQIGGAILFSEVITATIEARRALETSDAKYRSIFEQGAIGIARTTLDDRIIEVNDQFCVITGYARDDLLARSGLDLTLAEDRVASTALLDRLRAGKVSHLHYEARIRTGSGNIRWLHTTASLTTSDNGAGEIVKLVQDVTDRKELEAGVSANDARLRAAHQVAGVMAWECAPADIDAILPTIAEQFMLDQVRDGAIDEEVHGRVETPDALEATRRARVALRDRTPFEMMARVTDGPLGSRWIRLVGGADGPMKGLIGLVFDVTDIEEAKIKLRSAHEEVLRASRLSAMGAFASTLAHELNQPLTAAALYLQGCTAELAKRPELAELDEVINLASTEVLRVGEIIRRMRHFTLNGDIERREEDLGALLEEARAELLRSRPSAALTIDIDVEPDLPPVLVDRIQIGQVLNNLLQNAAEAMDEAPIRHIDIRAGLNGGMARIRIEDAGSGIQEGILAHIFEPFQTTKDHGTGLGLSICRTIVEAHGGKLWVDREFVGGTAVMLSLPPAMEKDLFDNGAG